MIPRPFEYHAPTSVDAALALLATHGSEAKLLAGGHSLLPMMKLRFADPAHLIDLNRISSLKGIRLEGNELRIGAMTSENDLIWSPLLAEHCPLLVETARQISDPQVRYRGTIGGDISHGDPGNDHPAVMLCLGASFVLKGSGGERVVAADGYFLGTYATAIEPDEIMTEIRIPMPAKDSGYCYAKLKRKTGDFATAAAAVLLKLDGNVVLDVSIALTNVGPTALKATDAENSLRRRPLTDSAIAEAASLAMSICDPVEDLRGNVEYKKAMAGEMTQRALRTAAERGIPCPRK
jgi:carbon-monoxide dehydrogenase medium subunit